MTVTLVITVLNKVIWLVFIVVINFVLGFGLEKSNGHFLQPPTK